MLGGDVGRKGRRDRTLRVLYRLTQDEWAAIIIRTPAVGPASWDNNTGALTGAAQKVDLIEKSVGGGRGIYAVKKEAHDIHIAIDLIERC